MDSRVSQVRWVLLGLAVLVTLLLVSCSAPPRKSTGPTLPSAPRPRIKEPDRASEQGRHRTKPAEKRKAEVTTTEVKPAAPGTTTATPVAPGVHHRKRLAGYPGEVAHTSSATKIALTFDAGASPAPTPAILKTLQAAGLHVTFFLTGRWCEQNPDLVKAIAADGHEIGNHSYSHKDFRKLTDEAIVAQLKRTDELVINLTGKTTRPLFRAPYGGRDKRVLSVAGQEGYTSVFWSLDSWDAFKRGITSAEIENRILSRVQGGDIILVHCGSAPTAAALPDLIDKLQKRGYQIVTVSELMAGG